MANKTNYYLRMKGHDTFKVAIRRGHEQAIVELLKQYHVSINDVDIVIPHQANLRIIESLTRKLNYPLEKVFVNIQKYGNTSAASIPIALDEAIKNKRIKKKDIVLLTAFGSGLTWVASLIRW